MDQRPYLVVVEDEAAGRQLLVRYLSKREATGVTGRCLPARNFAAS